MRVLLSGRAAAGIEVRSSAGHDVHLVAHAGVVAPRASEQGQRANPIRKQSRPLGTRLTRIDPHDQ
jgi:hypothetical protein